MTLSSSALLVCAGSLATLAGAASADYFVYIGTYTGQQSKGIYAFRLETATGKLAPVGLVAETANPTFLAVHPNGKLLYAANEITTFGGQKAGSVSAFAIDTKTGSLAALNQTSSRGAGPCHVSVDKTGKCLLLANYGGGSFAAIPLKADGSLSEATAFIQDSGSGPNAKRQSAPHAHSFNVSPDNRFAVAADLGVDKVFVYRLDPGKAALEANEPAYTAVSPGAGPRHFAFHPDGRHAYVINELNSTVTAFDYDAAKGVLKELQSIGTLPKDFTGNSSTAEVQVHPNGKFLYGSNRGHDSITIFAIDAKKGTLTLVDHVSTQGKVPRNFGIDPTGQFLLAANQNTNNVVVFRIDAKSGRLTPTGQSVEVGAPVCVKFVKVQ